MTSPPPPATASPAPPPSAAPVPTALRPAASSPAGAPTPPSGSGTPPTTPAAVPANGIRGRLESVAASARAGMSGTPGRLRTVGIVCVVATLLFGLAAGQSFRSADGALGRAAANSDQLVRIQAIQTNVVQADADATNAFLVGGLEPAAQRADYTEAIATASGLIAQAAQHQPADGAALSALNQSLITYTSQVEQARANNRQALPIGSQYLRSASADLRADALPLLKNLGEANDARVTEEFDRAARAASLWLVIAGLLALVVLALVARLAGPTHPPLRQRPAGGGGAGGARDAGGRHGRAAGGQGQRRLDPRRRLRRHPVHGPGADRRLRRQVQREPHADRPRLGRSVREGLAGLVRRGRRPRSAASRRTAPGLSPLPWDDYATAHAQIRALDDGGDWEGAVALATGLDADSGNTTFAAFDTASASSCRP